MNGRRRQVVRGAAVVLALGAASGAALLPVASGSDEVAGSPSITASAAAHALPTKARRPVGVTFPTAPRAVPGGGPPPPPPTVEAIRAHMDADDADSALHAAERFVQRQKWGRERDAAWLAIGLLHREAGRTNLASEAFTNARYTKGPLKRWAAYLEAEQDLHRGRAWSTIRECNALREEFADSDQAADCLRLTALAWVDTGNPGRARTAAEEYDAEHELGPISEQVELAIARMLMRKYPDSAVRNLRKLSVEFDAPLTGRVAAELLAELAERGVAGASVPDDVASKKKLAVSLRDCGRRDDARELYAELRELARTDRRLAAWVDSEAVAFGWRTHAWDDLATLYADKYAQTHAADDAWNAYVSLSRGARWTEAAASGRDGLARHGGTWTWRKGAEAVGQTYMLAREYSEARDLFDGLARRGGWTGRRARFNAAFSAFMLAKNTDDLAVRTERMADALARLATIVDAGRTYVVEARYWRARVHEALGDAASASADLAAVLEEAPFGWYATLARQRTPGVAMKPLQRNGRWAAASRPEAPPPSPSLALPSTLPVAAWVQPRQASMPAPYELLTWPLRAPTPERPADPGPTLRLFDPSRPPVSYAPSEFYDRDEASRLLDRFARDVGTTWTDLPAARDLAAVGLYDLSGPMFSRVYEDWRAAIRSGWHRHHAAARQVHHKPDEWRQLAYLVRDHHHADRFTYGVWDEVEDDHDRRTLLRLGWPLAHAHTVWREARDHDVDPYLILGLMRMESRYDATAVSSAGARGAMQIMPRTGHLLADLEHDVRFTAGELEDPAQAVGYGIRYLGALLDRFDGVFPAAVASYNAGPMNVTAWLDGTGTDMPIDEFVEHIPYRETRGYVKKVCAAYDTYIRLYEAPGAWVDLPDGFAGNYPEYVDF